MILFAYAMELTYLVAVVCTIGPTPLGALLAGWQAVQCPSAWQAFVVGALGTVALATVFGVAADFLPAWEVGWSMGRSWWQVHLMISPLVGVPLGAICAAYVNRRNTPPS